MALVNTSRDGTVFAGLDWGGSFHQLCLLDEHGDRLLQRRVEHTVDGLADLDDVLRKYRPVRVAIERAEGLLVEHLHAVANVEIYCI